MGFAYTDNRNIDYKFPYITTVFSASNYCGTHGNKAAVMVFYKDDIQVSIIFSVHCASASFVNFCEMYEIVHEIFISNYYLYKNDLISAYILMLFCHKAPIC